MGKYHPEDLERKANQFIDNYGDSDRRFGLIVQLLSLQFGMTNRAVLNKIRRIANGDHDE